MIYKKNKYFPYKKGVEINKLLIDEESSTFVTIPDDSDKISKLISIRMEKKFGISQENINIIDATACIGGDTLNFSTKFKHVISIEENQQRFNYLSNNINIYKCTNILPICGNSLEIICSLNCPMDVIYIDPPWGGKDYKFQKNLELTFGGKELNNAIHALFVSNVKIIVLKLPKNYNYDKFRELQNSFDIFIYYFLKKMNIVIIERKLSFI